MMAKLSIGLMLITITLAGCGQKNDTQESATQKQPAQEQMQMAQKNNLALHKHDENIKLAADQLYACTMDAEYVTSDPDTRCVKCEMELKPIAEVKPDFDTKQAELYTCSMHPEFVTSEATDQCPICEMNVRKIEVN